MFFVGFESHQPHFLLEYAGMLQIQEIPLNVEKSTLKGIFVFYVSINFIHRSEMILPKAKHNATFNATFFFFYNCSFSLFFTYFFG